MNGGMQVNLFNEIFVAVFLIIFYAYLRHKVKLKYGKANMYTLLPNSIFKWPCVIVSILLLIGMFCGIDRIYVGVWLLGTQYIDMIVALYYKK